MSNDKEADSQATAIQPESVAAYSNFINVEEQQVPDDDANQFDINTYDIVFDEIGDKLDVNINDYLVESSDTLSNDPFVNIDVEKLWAKFIDVDNCDLLEYQFKNSFIQQIYFDAMNIDRTPEGKLVSNSIPL